MRRLLAVRAFVALMLSLAAVHSAAAQGRQPLVLQHGFVSNAGTWDKFAPWIESQVYVGTSRYTTGWNATYTRQAIRLRNSITHLPDTTILLGHSNGGVIARRVAHLRPTKGFITVGSPHTGAPLARSIRDGTAALFLGKVFNVAGDAITFYERPDFYHPADWFRYAALSAAYASLYLGQAVHAVMAGMTVLDEFSESVLSDMDPGSPYFSVASGVNSLAQLDHELAILGNRRVVFTSAVTAGYFPEWMIWKGLMPDQSASLSLATDATWITLLLAYDHYANYWHDEDFMSYEKRAFAYVWLWAASVVGSMDISWCALIGAGFPFCGPADGIVPVSHQRHPGNGVMNVDLYGPAHQEQINSQAFRDGARDALLNVFKVKAPDIAPTHPLSVSIDGSDGTYVGMHSNTAWVLGGTDPVSYRWYLSGDGNNFQDTGVTAQSYSQYLDVGQMYWIKVVVTSGSEVASATKVLGPVCLENCY